MSTKQRLILSVYSAFIWLLLPFLFLHWLLKTILGTAGYGRDRTSRFSLFGKEVEETDILIHCVSVGESNVAISLINAMDNKGLNRSITVTTTTPTGAANIKKHLANRVQHLYLPIDTGLFMKRLIKRIKPQKVWIVEVELWPNMVHQCAKQNIPVSLINARMTDKSARRYAKLPNLFAPMLNNLTTVCAQSQRDLDNYIKLGMAPDRSYLTGNIKFDMVSRSAPDGHIQALFQNRTCLIAGSTHEPEEQFMIDAFKHLQDDAADLLLIIVPRHPQRFDKVFQLVRNNFVDSCRFSALPANQPLSPSCQVMVIDKMGLLSSIYSCASLAFVGGSIANRGGHNALEPAMWSVPVLMGPHTYNNPEICSALQDKGNLQLFETQEQFVRLCKDLLENSDKRRQAGQAGLEVIESNRGAITRTLSLLEV